MKSVLFVSSHIKLYGLVVAKTIHVEEQSSYNLIHTWRVPSFFPGYYSEMTELELAYYNVTVQHVSHHDTGTSQEK